MLTCMGGDRAVLNADPEGQHFPWTSFDITPPAMPQVPSQGPSRGPSRLAAAGASPAPTGSAATVTTAGVQAAKPFSAPAPRPPAPRAPAAPAALAAGSRGPGQITLQELQRALTSRSQSNVPKNPRDTERNRIMGEMEARVLSSMKHVLIYEDKAIQLQALEKIPVEEIKRKALESPGDLQPRDAIARHLLRCAPLLVTTARTGHVLRHCPVSCFLQPELSLRCGLVRGQLVQGLLFVGQQCAL